MFGAMAWFVFSVPGWLSNRKVEILRCEDITKAMLLPDEELFAAGGLIQCLFFKKHWPMEPHNAYSVGRRAGKQPAQLYQLLLGHQEVRYDREPQNRTHA